MYSTDCTCGIGPPYFITCLNCPLKLVKGYYYSIVAFVERKLYIFEAPPLIMVLESAHNLGE